MGLGVWVWGLGFRVVLRSFRSLGLFTGQGLSYHDMEPYDDVSQIVLGV